ncbi:chemotaxis protein CheB [Alterisphingorhabdus coralli]|uniref:protein-glutamate methylesterase n=1 Tax=Alterisphingorhabdus coralli TaxID=3071408 RepID=A0AA97I2P1_9SPHN|nr:chemotaxis protein CheB [Parasphingorhabdus sp. SCSIO 66989]WOE76458.1 chemotaxis protein CheB [Parasphingorhabdus sp. SCSIO 66989]
MKHQPIEARAGQGNGAPDQGCSPATPIRVMLVDDSMVVRSIVERLVSAHPQFEVVASLSGAQLALEVLKTQSVDIIILDIEMPCGNGLDAMPEMLALSDARILVLSSIAEPGGEAAVRALGMGACDTLAKPGRSSFAGQFGDILLDKLTALGRSHAGEAVLAKPLVTRAHCDGVSSPECIAIGSSTGGIPAMLEFVQALDDNIRAPIFLTQHLPGAFLPYLVRQLAEKTDRKVQLAETGERVAPKTIYIAPGHGHIMLVPAGEGRCIAVDTAGGERYVPAVDPMLDAVAEHYGDRAVAIILSGMGRDGFLGAKKVADAGGRVYAQDPATSTVWGMPGAVAREGIASAILPPAQIAADIARSYRADWPEGARHD